MANHEQSWDSAHQRKDISIGHQEADAVTVSYLSSDPRVYRNSGARILRYRANPTVTISRQVVASTFIRDHLVDIY